MPLPNIQPILFDSYLAFIKNSPKSRIWRNFYAKINDQRTDIMKNGKLSCAFFASSVLTIFQLIEKIHGTVDGVTRDLENSSWHKIQQPKVGSVLIWEEKISSFDKQLHKHIGFYIGNKKAISNSSKLKSPAIHHWTYGIANNKPKRKIKAIYWNKKLNKLN